VLRFSVLAMIAIGILQFSTTSVAATLSDVCSEGSISDQMVCLQSGYAAAELNLNTIYNARISFLKDRQQFDSSQSIFYENLESRLHISQRSWLQNRESQCELEAALSVQVTAIIPATMRCTIRIDNERAAFLSALAIPVRTK
jgi:uncharacterized protein YecT (DUF1311 family)